MIGSGQTNGAASAVVVHDVLGAGEVLQGVVGEVPAVAGAFEAVQGISLARVTASSSVLKVSTDTTGPKISVLVIAAPAGTSVTTVGSMK